MKYKPSKQLILGLIILLGGGGFIVGEYFLVKLYPVYQKKRVAELSELLPYTNEDMGIAMKIAYGIFGDVEKFTGGVRIRRKYFWSVGPSISITSRPNLDGTHKFAPTILAQWQTAGIREEIPQYRFWHTKIHNRDAVLIKLYKDRGIHLTGKIISPERIIEVDCAPGQEEEDLFLKLCEDTIRNVTILGTNISPANNDQIIELQPRTTNPN